MFAIAATIAVFGALFVALLAVPLMLVIDAERVETLKTTWQIRWLFGLVDLRLPRDPPVATPVRAIGRQQPRPHLSQEQEEKGANGHRRLAHARPASAGEATVIGVVSARDAGGVAVESGVWFR